MSEQENKLNPPQLPNGEIVDVPGEDQDTEFVPEDTTTDNMDENVSEDKEDFPPFKDNQPCNWYIIPVGKKIEARNDASGEKFKGTLKEFNKRLRG
jgi:hypothetical protein